MKIYFQLFLIFYYSTFTLRFNGLATVSPIGEAALQVFYTRCCPGSSHAILVRILACQIASTRLFHFPPMSGSSATFLPPLSLWLGLPFARCLRETSDFSMNLGAGVGFEPTMAYASLQPSLVAYTVAFDHSANPPVFVLHFSLNFILTTSYRRIIHPLCSWLFDSEGTPSASSLLSRQDA